MKHQRKLIELNVFIISASKNNRASFFFPPMQMHIVIRNWKIQCLFGFNLAFIFLFNIPLHFPSNENHLKTQCKNQSNVSYEDSA